MRRPTADDRLDMTLEAMEVTEKLPSEVLKVELIMENGDAIEFSGASVRVGKASNTYICVGDAELVKGAWLGHSPQQSTAAAAGGDVEEDAVQAILRAPMTARQVVNSAYDKLKDPIDNDDADSDDEVPDLIMTARGL